MPHIQSAILLLGVYPREKEIHVYAKSCTQMVKVVCYSPKLETTQVSTTDEQINTGLYIYTGNTLLLIKRNDTCKNADDFQNNYAE